MKKARHKGALLRTYAAVNKISITKIFIRIFK